jgi:hypothetical protein
VTGNPSNNGCGFGVLVVRTASVIGVDLPADLCPLRAGRVLEQEVAP